MFSPVLQFFTFLRTDSSESLVFLKVFPPFSDRVICLLLLPCSSFSALCSVSACLNAVSSPSKQVLTGDFLPPSYDMTYDVDMAVTGLPSFTSWRYNHLCEGRACLKQFSLAYGLSVCKKFEL